MKVRKGEKEKKKNQEIEHARATGHLRMEGNTDRKRDSKQTHVVLCCELKTEGEQ